MKHSSLIFFAVSVLSLASCSDPDKVAFEEKKKLDSAQAIVAKQDTVIKKVEQFSEEEGFVGIYEVPEMLTLCIKDSATEKNIAKKYAEAFLSLEKELQELGMKSSGAPGSLNYNNDPTNFIFECVYPIAKMPTKQPKKCQVVVLEQSNMLIYNYYGPYVYLYTAYDNIRNKMKASSLEQSGPMREFYITDPVKVSDSTKWLTRIMVPVTPKKEKPLK